MKTVALLFLLVAFCNCDTSLDMNKAFLDHQVVQDTLSVAPQKTLNVCFNEIQSILLVSRILIGYCLRCHIGVEFRQILAMN